MIKLVEKSGHSAIIHEVVTEEAVGSWRRKPSLTQVGLKAFAKLVQVVAVEEVMALLTVEDIEAFTASTATVQVGEERREFGQVDVLQGKYNYNLFHLHALLKFIRLSLKIFTIKTSHKNSYKARHLYFVCLLSNVLFMSSHSLFCPFSFFRWNVGVTYVIYRNKSTK